MNGSMAQYEVRELNPTVRGHDISYYPYDHPYAQPMSADRYGRGGMGEREAGYIPPLFMEDGGTSSSKKNTYHIPMPPTQEAQTNGGFGGIFGPPPPPSPPTQNYDGTTDLGLTWTVVEGNFSADPYDPRTDWSIDTGFMSVPPFYDPEVDWRRFDDSYDEPGRIGLVRLRVGF